jgi:tetratricopeptide (TPR) repeat protein
MVTFRPIKHDVIAIDLHRVMLGLFMLCAIEPNQSTARDADRSSTDYGTEIAEFDKAIAELQMRSTSALLDLDASTRHANLLYQRATLTGNLAALDAVESMIAESVRVHGATEDLILLLSHLHFKLHRLSDVRDDLARLDTLADSAQGRALKADLAFQEGQVEEARQGYEDLARRYPTWDNLARLAYFRAKTGDVASADRLYEKAEDEITAKEMRAFAWVELQRGQLALGSGRNHDALAHYDRADKAYSGYWLIGEHRAELLANMGQFDKAVELYQQLLVNSPWPELQQALGDLYRFMGQQELARPWHEKARVAYLDVAKRGGAHYYHHLTGFYADVVEDGPEAVTWARKDLALRRNYATQDALAWALYRKGEVDKALEFAKQALASGIIDPHLYYHSAMIHMAAGRVEEGRKFLMKTSEINPNYNKFHVHR